jgi:cytochrome c553
MSAKRLHRRCLAALPLLCSALAAAAAGDPVAGRAKAEDERCIECHGTQGEGRGPGGPSGAAPPLQGQTANALLKHLADYRSGARKHDVMTIMARSVDEADLVDIAAYFAAQGAGKGGEGR